MSKSQTKTPLLDILQELAQKPNAAFYTPGHKRGQGTYPKLADLFGTEVFKADLPELPELDNLFAPEGAIQEAQALAAEAFGASETWFLVNGSTCGVMAAILATCGEGDKIILPRNCHSSAIAGLILSGATPLFITPEYDPQQDLTLSITPEALLATLKQHPDTKAVMMVYPTYQGICGDIGAIASITHAYNIPLLVDEAHGAHFTFSPDLPPSALSKGADLSIQSTHKTLGAMTQASMLHLQGSRIQSERISIALQLLQSTSPSYLLLASLDAARQQMALLGTELLHKALTLADEARSRIRQIPGLSVLEPISQPLPGFMTLDRTRLTVNVTQLNLTGFEVDEILHTQCGVTAELPLLHQLTFIISWGNTPTDINKLVEAFTQITMNPRRIEDAQETRKTHWQQACSLLSSSAKISPRQAFFGKRETLPLHKATGCISAELICPYPPGIPVIMPGEVITTPAIDYLQQVLSLGGKITGCSDSTLQTLKVVKP